MGLSLQFSEDRLSCSVGADTPPTAKTLQLRVPSDKSLTHRALMFASIAEGQSKIEKPLWGSDCRSTLTCFEAMAVRVTKQEVVSSEGSTDLALSVDSPGLLGLKSPVAPLDFGNSGTTARLLTGLFAGVDELFVTAFGDHSLSERPMGRVIKPLKAMGGEIQGRKGSEYLPIAISGRKLRPAVHAVDKASAQVKSALLLAALQVEGSVQVSLPSGSRDHTERFLLKQGAPLTVNRLDGLETLTFRGPWLPVPAKVTIPADPSSAAFFAILPALFQDLEVKLSEVLDNDTRCGFLKVLQRMGLQIEANPNGSGRFVEAVQELTIRRGELVPVEVLAAELPTLIDEVPILAVAAAFAPGESIFRDLHELRVKESDRLVKTADLLMKAGVKVRIEGDDLHIFGPVQKIKPFDYDPAYDHRLAMAAAILAIRASGPCRIRTPDCIDVSFPGFFQELRRLW